MDSLITRRGAIAAAKQEGDWGRPSDWLPLPSVNDTEQKFAGLHAIFEDANFVALRCQGAYTVDWGDGVVENFTSNTTAYHEYNYATYDTSNTTLCSRGYKQAIVTVTPQLGQNLSNFNLGVKHNQTGLVNGYATGWLDIILNLPQAINNGIVFYNTSVFNRILEQVNFKNIGAETNMTSMFAGCNSLRSVNLNTASVTNMAIMTNMFAGCSSLQSVSLNTVNATNMTGMFTSCSALRSVNLNTANVTNVTNMFQYASPLQSVILNGLKFTIDVSNNKLSANALNNLFTSLGTVSGKTITITGNYGAATCDRSIATAKGWTVTG